MSTIDSTVDSREVEFYTKMADAWWDRNGAFWPIHTLNELRVTYIRDYLRSHFQRDSSTDAPLAGLRILDVGCGGGILSESMATMGAAITGIDIVDRNIGVSRLHARQQGLDIDYRKCTAAELAADAEPFDVVLNMEVVEHVADLDAFMRDCASMTAAGGIMFVSTINRTTLSWLFAIIGAEYILRWLPRGTHRWTMFRKPEEIERLLGDNGLEVRDSAGVDINPLTRQFRLKSSLQVNYMLTAERPTHP